MVGTRDSRDVCVNQAVKIEKIFLARVYFGKSTRQKGSKRPAHYVASYGYCQGWAACHGKVNINLLESKLAPVPLLCKIVAMSINVTVL